MSPREAIAESRVQIAVDTRFAPLVYYCSTWPLEQVREKLIAAGCISFPDTLAVLGDENARLMFVTLEEASVTQNWEPMLPATAVDKLADLVR